MNRHHLTTITTLAAGVLLALGSTTSFAGELRTVEKPVPGQYIVVFKDSAASLEGESNDAARVSLVAESLALSTDTKVIESFDYALRGFVVQANDKQLESLLIDPRVAYVEEDGFTSVDATQTGATWGLDRVDQRDLPLNGTYVYNTTASNVHAYIIDTGVLGTHSQFSGRMGNGYDAIGGGTTDCNGHGTHVAGTVGGTTWGVAKGVTIHPVRVLGCNGSGTNSGVIAGMNWVAGNRILPAVANMSLGGSASSAIDSAVANLTNAKVTVVVAAGNDNGNACNKSPARAPSAITVGSTTNTDARSSFSNFGTCVDIFAPGSSITSAWHTSSTASNTISGTSMAAPHAAGGAALYLASNPGATPAQVTSALIGNATLNKVGNAGSGSPNRLLYTGAATPPPPPPSCGALLSGQQLTMGQSKLSCDGRFSLIMQNDGNLVLYKVTPTVTALWASNTAQGGTLGANSRAAMQTDGNLVVYNQFNQPRWSSVTHTHAGAWLNVQNDGNLVIYNTSNTAVWSSGTHGH